ncbi:MAG: M28 family peptidase [Bacteroidia bacterium]|nr:M28 family peptidase [Bacteroidia bacterium]
MNKKKLFFLCINCWLGFTLFAQLPQPIVLNKDSVTIRNQAISDITLLCSEYMSGRGYVEDGHLRAANHIASTFRNLNLQAFNTHPNLIQPFEFSINLITNATIEAPFPLKYGQDFIVQADCPPINFDKTRCVDLEYGLPDDFSKNTVKERWVVIKEGLPKTLQNVDSLKQYLKEKPKIALAEQRGALGVIVLRKKLTASFSKEAGVFPVVEVLTSSWKKTSWVKVHVESGDQVIQSQNVVAWIPGSEHPDSAIILCAHYDHLGKVGNAIFPGANDNASGVAFLMTLARYFSVPQHKCRYSLIFIAFGAEETGLTGSLFYALQEPIFPIERTRFVLNFDLIGNGQEGVMAVGAETFPELFAKYKLHNDSLQLVNPLQTRPNAPNSDHYPFTLKKVPALFFYTQGGSKFYHDIHDKPRALKLPIFYNFYKLTATFLEKL